MNTTLSKLIIFISFIIIASSCNNTRGISITKRHYSKGNYVSVSKKQKSFVNHTPTKKTESIGVEQPAIAAESNEPLKENIVIEANSNQNLSTNKAASSNNLADMINSAENQKTKDLEHSSSIVKKRNFNKVRLLEFKKTQPDSDARSLFWLVITILLIIWLIALLSGGWGLGGLVNILLVIALILFILWLLRLI